MYNVLRGVLIVVTVFVFVFVQRGFVAPVEILVHPNAWMGRSPRGSDTPPYCDNNNIHYYWSDDWIYRNITCKPVSLNGRFIKYLGLGNFFVPTMITEKTFIPCPEERDHCCSSTARQWKRMPQRISPTGGRSETLIRHVGRGLGGVSRNRRVCPGNFDSRK